MPGEVPLDGFGLVHALHQGRVRFVVIGGFAVIAHGLVRATRDLDICPDPASDNLERLAAVLRALHVAMHGSDDFAASELPVDPSQAEGFAAGGNVRLMTDLGRLDVMQWLVGVGDPAYADLDRDAWEIEWRGVPVRIASLRALRAMKHAAGRPQDLADLAGLEAAHPPPGLSDS